VIGQITALIGWFLNQDNAPAVGAIGLLFSAVGFPLTVWGLRLTFVQARKATDAASAATRAVATFKFRLERYSAYRDVSEAEFAMDACKRHLETESWKHASESYEVARKAMIRVQQTSINLPGDVKDQLRQITEHINSFCSRVDAAIAGKGNYPSSSKVASTIRTNYETLSAVKIMLEKEIAQ
jgi:hypothetical protein